MLSEHCVKINLDYFPEKRFSDRSINIDLEGEPCIRDMRMLAVQGIAGYPLPPTQAILLRCDLRVDDGALDASLFSKDAAPGIDTNVILNGLIVERMYRGSGLGGSGLDIASTEARIPVPSPEPRAPSPITINVIPTYY